MPAICIIAGGVLRQNPEWFNGAANAGTWLIAVGVAWLFLCAIAFIGAMSDY